MNNPSTFNGVLLTIMSTPLQKLKRWKKEQVHAERAFVSFFMSEIAVIDRPARETDNLKFYPLSKQLPSVAMCTEGTKLPVMGDLTTFCQHYRIFTWCLFPIAVTYKLQKDL